MISKFDSFCRLCKKKIKKGQPIWYNIKSKKVAHKACFETRGHKAKKDMGSRTGTERIDVRGIARSAGRNYRDVK
jgi:hypothetical protein